MRLFFAVCLFSFSHLVAGEVPRLLLGEDNRPHGLPGIAAQAETLSIEDLDASMVVLVVFDLYCPACQKSAGNMKRLAEQILTDFPSVPVVGIGSGDTVFETRKFKEKFKLPFLCISDREETVSDYYQVERTPSVIVLSRNDEGEALSEVYRNEAYLGREHIEEIITLLKEAS